MARLQRNRARYEAAGRTLSKYVGKIGITPNQLTAISMGFAVAAAVAISYQQLILTLVCLGLVGVFDMLDGSVARATGKANQFGGVLDHVVDRYAEMAILLGIMRTGLVAPEWVLLSLFGMIMASYTRARAESKPAMDNCNVGLVGRMEKLLILVAGMVLEFTGLLQGTLVWAVIAVGLVSHITVVQRLIYSHKVLSKEIE